MTWTTRRIVLAGIAAVAGGWAGAAEIDFNRDIRPILSDRCYHCHGPDAENQKSDFRVDTFAHITEDLGGYAGVVPGQPENSELMKRLLSKDPDDVMPPPDSNRVVSDKERALLKAWIEQGAEYAEHWAFVPPKQAALPKGESPHPVDAFVAIRLKKEGLAFSGEADRPTLARRVALITTGLPATPDEVAAFVEDTKLGAYERMVDRYLASPHYAERMATAWLDVARFADTDGYQNDGERSNWPWRDWVISAYDRNMPFDEFTVKQLAGDLLPNPTEDDLLATAFNRNHRQNSEGGALAPEFFVENVIDRIETTGTAWLGLTLNCCRCHDHKYDPIKQTDFYSLFAYFNNIGEKGIGKGTGANPILKIHSPLLTPPEELLAQRKQAAERVQTVEKGLAQRAEAWAAEAVVKAARVVRPVWREQVLGRAEASDDMGTIERGEDGAYVFEGQNVTAVDYTLDVHDDQPVHALRIDVLPDESFSAPRKLSRSVNGNFVVSELEVYARTADGKRSRIQPDRISASFEQLNYAAAHLVDKNLKTGWAVFGPDVKPETVELFVSLPEAVSPGPGGALEVVLRHRSSFADHNLCKFKVYASTTDLPDAAKGAVAPNVLAAARKPVGERSAQENKLIIDTYRPTDAALLEAKAELSKIEKEFGRYPEVPVMIMREKGGAPTPAYRLDRGQYDQPDKSVVMTRSLPAALFVGGPEEQPKDRLGLALWLVSAENPLTSRVVVNRLWQQVFGIGLVKTAEDFGLQSETPSHPALLDWLAVEFREGGWNTKAMLRLLLTSQAFRQDSRVTRELLRLDPDNRLLARGPRYRLDPYAIRDSVLYASGLLVDRRGGPPVKPYQPAGLWQSMNQNAGFKYQPSTDDDLYRKTMYTYWKRAVNPPMLSIFDAARRDICEVVKRVTNTPLQALALMNDETYVEAARHLAERALREQSLTTPPRDRLAYMASLVRGVAPDAATLDVLANNLNWFRTHYSLEPADAVAFLEVGASEAPADLHPVEHAAWAAVAHLILNLDETITVE